jgi:N,N'-diacetylchitobiose phosphorylase
VMAVVGTNPEKARQRLVELLNAITGDGYALHLFDPELFKPKDERREGGKLPTVVPGGGAPAVHGLEDTCADDALWLIPSICEWVKESGEISFFDEVVPYAGGGQGTVYEHMTRIVEFSAAHVGSHGICQGLRADWNDCLNLGGGESAMVSFLHHWALRCVAEAAGHLGREDDAKRYAGMAKKVKTTCENILWDGEWYLRGFTGSGKKIGTAADDEGKLFLNAQSWAVLSGVAGPERGRQGMDAVHKHLSSDYGLHMLWPAYSSPDDEVGYVTRVYKGVKENGSIFSHPNAWAVAAECALGRGARAVKIYDAILPVNQNDIIEIREAEPYAYCQFVMGRDHTAHGRAVHPWLTGTTCWMYTAVTRYLLGVRPGYEGLTIDPCIPPDWKGLTVSRRWREATFDITVKNPDSVEKGVTSVTLDGEPMTGPIPPQQPGSTHAVEVVMGD